MDRTSGITPDPGLKISLSLSHPSPPLGSNLAIHPNHLFIWEAIADRPTGYWFGLPPPAKNDFSTTPFNGSALPGSDFQLFLPVFCNP